MALAASMALFTACTDNNEPGNGNGGEDDKYELTKDIESDTELEAGKTYTLSGGIHVKNGATLKIPAGVTIIAKHDDVVDYILIEQGAKIDAQGTASNPIVMTSEKKEPGAWGGIHICGYAHTNAEGGTGSSEIGGAPYGGNNDNDNSGTLRYVRVEYTGFAFDEEHEANGITFYGVGNGTTVEYCQAYMGSDDGFEWFGGSVNVKYLVSTDCSDDSFDWTEGWNGKAQFLVAYQSPKDELGYDCDCLMECDNNGKSFGATPVACPTLANLTLIGNGESKQGIRLRAGTKAKIYNAIVKGKGQCLTTETTETENALMDGSSELQYITLATNISCKEGIYSSNEFTKDGNHNIINYSVMFTNGYVGTIESGKNLSDDNFFTQAAYQGAVPASNDWTQGWTLKSGITEETIEELKGEITTSKTLAEGKTYYLTGEYKVKNGATLKIEPGVTIIAKHDDIVDYLLVEQGSKIDAQGTAENPIVMTSEKKEAGAWGGIHICGYAHTNVAGGTGSSEIGGATYGGNNDADNSGTLRYEYSGYAFDEEHEANGFTFYGVGNGTTVEYCQAYQGSDDGFEFFGGSVNIKYCVSTSCSDDSFDWTEGWNGKAQFLVAGVLLGDEVFHHGALFCRVLHEDGLAGEDDAFKGRGDLAGDDLRAEDGGEAALGIPLEALDLVPVGGGVEVELVPHQDVVDRGGIGVSVVPLDGQGAVVAFLEQFQGIGIGELALGFIHVVYHRGVLLYRILSVTIADRKKITCCSCITGENNLHWNQTSTL